MSEQYRVPGDPNMAHWPEWTGEGVPPEPYLRRETKLVTEREYVPVYLPAGVRARMHIIEPGQTKVIWKLYGDHWLKTLGTEFVHYGPGGFPEVIT